MAGLARHIERQLDQASSLCLQHNTQLTDLRRTVLGLVLQSDRPLTAYQLLDRLRQTRRGAVPPTIYRALDFLIDNKLIHKVEKLGAFIACEAGHHDHSVQFLICRVCGRVWEMEDEPVQGALDTAAHAHGFTPSSTIVEIEGVCAECSEVKPAS